MSNKITGFKMSVELQSGKVIEAEVTAAEGGAHFRRLVLKQVGRSWDRPVWHTVKAVRL